MGIPVVNMAVGGPKAPTNCTYKTVVLQNNIGFAEQIGAADTKYVIRWDFNLGRGTVIIPENCVLEFDGGSLSNGTIVGQDTYLMYCGLKEDILKVTLEGTFTDKYYLKSEIDNLLAATMSGLLYDMAKVTIIGVAADDEDKVAPNDYAKGDIFFIWEDDDTDDTKKVRRFFIAKESGEEGADLTDTSLFDTTQSATEAAAISDGYKYVTPDSLTPTTEAIAEIRSSIDRSGTELPTLTAEDAGYTMFFKVRQKPVWWTGTKWVYADGTDVL